MDQLQERRYRSRVPEIQRRLRLLLQDPYAAAGAERLRHTYTGLRSARVSASKRLIYRICEECQRLSEQERWALDCCLDPQTELRMVNVLCLSEHYANVPERFAFQS